MSDVIATLEQKLVTWECEGAVKVCDNSLEVAARLRNRLDYLDTRK